MFEDDVSSAADRRADVGIKCEWKVMQPMLKYMYVYIYIVVLPYPLIQ
jgi:hypothetical protein